MPGGDEPEILSSPLPADDVGRLRRSLRGPRGRCRTFVAAVGLAGLLAGWLVGGVGGRRDTPPPHSQAGPVDVRVSLGVGAGTPPVPVAGRAVVEVPLVLTNEAGSTVRLAAIQVSGPGAGLAADPLGRPTPDLPLRLAPGQSFDVRFGLSSDCAVSVRPLPRVTLVLLDAEDRQHDVAASIPDLDTIWGQTLLPGACG